MGWSHRAADYYTRFLAPSTLLLYNRYIAMFHVFCVEKGLEFPRELHDESAIIAEFMCSKAEASDRPESMLTSVLASLTALNSGPLPKYLYNLKQALVKGCTTRGKGRTPVMTVQPFVKLFEQWGEDAGLTLKRLRQKCITLIALCAMCRPSDLIFKRNELVFNLDGTVTLNFFAIKNDKDRQGFEVRLQPAQNTLCDPVTTLNNYVSRTQHMSDGSGPLFLSLRPPHVAIGVAAVSDDLRASIEQAGLDTKMFTPRSFRPTGATASVRSGNDPEVTRQIGRWKSHDVFYDRYVYPVAEASFTDKILSSDINI